MLSLPNDGRYPALDLTPEQRRQRTLEALVSQMEALARQNPVLMIFEDAHWTDPTSLEVFGRVVDRVRSLRVLLIVTFRPEFDPPWIGRPYVTFLTINRLGEREILAMIEGVVGNKPLPANIRQDIIERTDGIPLFVEEMTKAVLEAESEGAAQRTVALPFRPRIGGPGKPASIADGAARPARPSQGGGADRCSNRARVLACPIGCGCAASRRRSWHRRSTVSLPLVCCSGKASRPMRPTCLSTPWCKTRPMARCCGSRDAHFMLELPKPSRTVRGHRREPARVAGASLHRGWADRESGAPCGAKRDCGRWIARLWSKLRSSSRVALDQIATLPATPALRREQIKLQVALITPLMHTKGYAAPETKAAVEQARLLIEQAEALGEPPEDPLLLFSVLYGFWVANTRSVQWRRDARACGPVSGACREAKDDCPAHDRASSHGPSLCCLRETSRKAERTSIRRSRFTILPSIVRWRRDLAINDVGGDLVLSIVGLVDAWLSRAALVDAEHALKDAREIGHAATLLCALAAPCIVAHVCCGNYATAKRNRR